MIHISLPISYNIKIRTLSVLILESVEKIHCFTLHCIRSNSGKSLQSKGEMRVDRATSCRKLFELMTNDSSTYIMLPVV